MLEKLFEWLANISYYGKVNVLPGEMGGSQQKQENIRK